ncbi:ATP-dependent endonuclease [Brenneria roseae subsp. americana]|uniref:ATP-dependent endonuclease n=1 Tax=Brenneria roseae subsp. americana TaxID=1508507 RepID=A0A2U1TLX2_9GAMM|nr:ATP-dependent endonuclease [Brenneria roseae]PWC10401.1 ATP-dependent endonuclease [Brenneria roseae subsp. americana]
MYLENIEILGFRGINRLSLMLGDNTVLIGENAWGKSSLLDALSLLLAPTLPLYHFDLQDFYFNPGDENSRERHLQIIFTFCEAGPGHHLAPRYRPLKRVWVEGQESLHRIFYRLEGEVDESQVVFTWRSFLDAEGHPIKLNDIDGLAREVIRLHPVLRLRDARFIRRLRTGTLAATMDNSNEKLAQQFEQLMRELAHNPQKLTDKELRQGLVAIQQLLEHYFSEQGSVTSERHHRHERAHNGKSWRSLDNINRLIAEPNSRSRRIILLGLFSTLLQAKGSVALDPHSRPLLLIEDPETRLHPIMLSVAWGLLMQLPLQKVTTTNSGELLSLVPMEQVCRLVRESSRVATFRIGPQGMSAEDSRRIAFHIRLNRPASLFARCWLLVEGETEVWMLNELARQCGHHFEAEGVKVIEFAQSGLRPLVKFARRMGIEWHVLVDGDEAGKKYAATAKSMLSHQQGDSERDHLTVLPALDMEHYMYREGFSHVYHRIAQLPEKVPLSMHKIIVKAIHRSSKPDLAIEVAMEAASMGGDAIPPLIRSMFSRVLWLARGRAD